MLANVTLQDVLHVVILLAGVIWLLKKVAEMERYHYLRVWVLTAILTCFITYFFLGYCLTMAGNVPFDDYFEFSGNSTSQY